MTEGQRLYEVICKYSEGGGWAHWSKISTEAQKRYEDMAREFSRSSDQSRKASA